MCVNVCEAILHLYSLLTGNHTEQVGRPFPSPFFTFSSPFSRSLYPVPDFNLVAVQLIHNMTEAERISTWPERDIHLQV